MSTTTPTTRDSIQHCNETLDAILRRRFGVTLRTYKTLKALAQLATVALGFYAISKGADATLVFAIVGTVVVGPEAIETALANQAPQPQSQDED